MSASMSASGSASVSAALATALQERRAAALVGVVDGPGLGAKLLVHADGTTVGTLGDPALDTAITLDAVGDLATGSTRVRRYGRHGESGGTAVEVFVESFAPPPRMLVFGAVDFTDALTRVATVLGYRVTVCDARATFTTPQRLPLADEVVVDWPHRLLERVGPTLTTRDACCVLTHDPKFDVPAIVAALATDLGYVGVMGSRSTHADRLDRLRTAGVGEQDIARIHAPIGLSLGARTPEETAVSICAEIIAVRAGETDVRPLGALTGPIHRV